MAGRDRFRPGLWSPGVMRGYATAGTDDGHAGGPWAEWAIGHPEKKLVDFGHRAVHETSVQAKAIVAAFYKRDPSKSYFVGCSDGGREALMEAQRYPDDFHGIIAGAPANNWTGLMTMALSIERALDEADLPASKLPAIQAAALSACDSLDDVKDGTIEDPRVCRFDPAVLTCKGQENISASRQAGHHTAKDFHQGPKRHPSTGVQVAPGFRPRDPGGPGWLGPLDPSATARSTGASDYISHRRVRQFVLRSGCRGGSQVGLPQVELRVRLRFCRRENGRDTQLDESRPAMFRAAGGKLLQYHGWGDAAIPGTSWIEYTTACAPSWRNTRSKTTGTK